MGRGLRDSPAYARFGTKCPKAPPQNVDSIYVKRGPDVKTYRPPWKRPRKALHRAAFQGRIVNTSPPFPPHVLPLLAAVEESDDVDGLLVLLNTVGGDIEAGLGIAELIASMSKPTVSLVLGGGHSIGVPLAVSAKRSFIAPSAAMTIHPVRLNGLVIAVSQTFNYFARIQERIIQFVTRNSRVKREDFTRLMLQTGELAADVGSVIYGEEAVGIGLIDRIGGLSDALACLHEKMEKVSASSP